MAELRGFHVYHEPSAINGDTIDAVLTLHSENVKTGDMIQLWSIPSDEKPSDAAKSGSDASVCGCRLERK